MSERLVVVGAGGFGRESLDVAEAMNDAAPQPVWEILGVVDDSPSEQNLVRLRDRNVPYLGDLACIPKASRVAIAVGAPHARRMLDDRLVRRGFEFAALIHPTAVTGSRVSMLSGAVICALVSIGTNVALGRHVHLNPQVVVGHDTRLDDFVSVNPNATLSGDCHVSTDVLIGAAALVLPGLHVGASATVGGGACVVKDVPERAVVKGVPAR